MPSTLTFPGVYVEEIPSGVRTIAGVATAGWAIAATAVTALLATIVIARVPIEPGRPVEHVIRTARVGIDYAAEPWRSQPWRLIDGDSAQR